MDTSDPILTLIGWFLFLGTFALAISITIGWLTDRWRLYIMSRRVSVPEYAQSAAGQRPDAVGQDVGQPGTDRAGQSRTLAAHLGTLDDDALLDVIALIPGEDDDYRFADTRVARFIGGRVDDRIAQVRAVRGAPTTARPAAYVTPIAGRPTKATFCETDDGLRYEEPPK